MRRVRALYAPRRYAVANAGVCILNRPHKNLAAPGFEAVYRPSRAHTTTGRGCAGSKSGL